MNSICVADTSSLILLERVVILQDLVVHYNVFIAGHVYSELVSNDNSNTQKFNQFKDNNSLTVHSVDSLNDIDEPPLSLHKGEQETIALFYHCKNNYGTNVFIVIDDKKGAQYCKRNDIPFINALLVPKILFYKNVISEFKYMETFRALKHIGRYSDHILSSADSFTEQELSFFM